MYLSSKQHDLLQIIISGFEIPYRSYVATEIINRFPTENEFTTELMNRQIGSTLDSNYQVISSELGKMKTNSAYFYALFTNANNAKQNS